MEIGNCETAPRTISNLYFPISNLHKEKTMSFVITGSVAYDYFMNYPGRFRDHILPDQLLSLIHISEPTRPY